MNLWTPQELCDSIRPERVNAVMAFGFTERQARFLVHVLVHTWRCAAHALEPSRSWQATPIYGRLSGTCI